MKCPWVFYNVEKNAIEFGSYGQQHIPFLRGWVCCENKDCDHSKYTGWATSPKGVAHFRNGRLNGGCYTWGRTRWHGMQINELGIFYSIGEFEDGKLIKKINFGVDNHINFWPDHNFGFPNSLSLFLMQKKPWLNFRDASSKEIQYSEEYFFNYEDEPEHYIMNRFIKRKSISTFYTEYFFKYLSLNQKLCITKLLTSLKGQIDNENPIAGELVPKEYPGNNPFRWIISFTSSDWL